MAFASVVDLANCDQFRQTLEARPPRIVHGAVTLIVALLAAAITWAALTEAELVVRAGGRIRPITAPQKVLATFRGEVLTGGAGALVREVHFTEGSYVNKGDVLLCLDNERLDNDIERILELTFGPVAAATVIGQGRQRADHVIVALNLTEAGFLGPDGDQDFGRHAKALRHVGRYAGQATTGLGGQ